MLKEKSDARFPPLTKHCNSADSNERPTEYATISCVSYTGPVCPAVSWVLSCILARPVCMCV